MTDLQIIKLSSQAKDISGVRSGRLLALYPVAKDKAHQIMWLCQCDCGNKTNVTATRLISGHTKSCGCLRVIVGKENKTHGLRKSKEYSVWAGMRQRCNNTNNPSYKWYGGRGITISDEWASFQKFYVDMGPRPSANHTIERRDVNLGYSKENCYWTDDCALQAINQNLKSNNTSGKSGVYYVKAIGKWVAMTFAKNKFKVHGTFNKKEDAIKCRINAEIAVYGIVKPDQDFRYVV